MNKRLLFFSFILFFLTSFQAFTQESCNNGTDDDGDGLVDCTDGDCQFASNIEKGCNCGDGVDNDGDGKIDEGDGDCASYYGLSFAGDENICSGINGGTSGSGAFDFVGEPATSGQNTVDTQSKVAIGDVNCDGIPDVVTTSKWNQTIRVVATADNEPDGSDKGDVIQDFKTPGAKIFPKGNFFFELEILIVDIDGSCPAEIYSIVSKRKNANSEPDGYYLVGFRANASPSGADLVPLFDAVLLGTERPGSLGIADFDCDGEAEIFLKDRIYDAETGELLADGNGGDWNTEVNSAPIVADIIPGGNLEMVSGNIIYNVPDLTDGTTQNLTVVTDMNALGGDQWFPKELFDSNEYGYTNFSSTSVADVNGDGNLDIVLSGALGSESGPTAVFFWDVTNGTVDSFLPPDDTYPDGWPWGTSRPNLGDLDGDGDLEVTFVAGNKLWALDVDASGNWVEFWDEPRTINDSLSGIISTTVYDFDNDGSPELVYRDSQQLVIVDGETGQNVLWSTACQSHTMNEGPLIADVDGDGSTDLCATCNFGNSFDINDPIQQQALGELRCYFSEDDSWLPTRQVWNQQGYNVVNIGDDLSVPCPGLDMTTQFVGDCNGDGVETIQTPLNTFMNQVPTFDAGGCPYYPAPDISFVGDDPTLEPGDPGYVDPSDPDYFPAVSVVPPTCGDLGIEVAFNIINSGSLTITADMDVSFWENNPTIPTDTLTGEPASLLHTTTLQLSGLNVDDTLSQSGITFDYSGEVSVLYIVLNDDGTQFPIDLTVNEFDECFIDNNIYAFPITPEPFTVEIEKISDNTNCDTSDPTINTGELRAVVKRDGVEVSDLSPYGFQWYNGADTTAAVVPNADGGNTDRLTNLANGDYTLVVTNLEKGCASLPISETIIQTRSTPEVSIVVNSHQTVCVPPDGELEVVVADGDLTGITFDWRDDAFSSLGITGPVASDLEEGGYAVIVSRNGCDTTLQATINAPVERNVSASVLQNVIDCSNLQSGEITTEAVISGVTQDPNNFTFKWYFYDEATMTLGSLLPSANGTGPTRTGLDPGFYAVIASEDATGCQSVNIDVVEVKDQTVLPTVIISEVSPQTSCDSSQPNGVLEAEINGGEDPANFTIEWFVGDNTLPANLHTSTSGVNGEIAKNVGGGGVPYIVKVTNSNNCFATDNYVVSEDINVPLITVSKTNNTICDPSLAASSYNGSITINSLTFDGAAIPLPDPNYEFTWYNGSSTSDPVIGVGDPTNPALTELEGDRSYTVVASRTDLYCTSTPAVVQIQNVTELPTIDVQITPMTTCSGTSNGKAEARVDLGGSFTTSGYTFEWFVGNDVTGANVAVTSGTENQIAEELDGSLGNNTYTVSVVNETTGCTSTKTITVPDQSELPVLTLNHVDNSICDSGIGYNGSITATVEYKESTITLPDVNYQFTWYDGDDTSAPVIAVTDDTAPMLAELDGGYYTVTVENLALKCLSDPATVEVIDDIIYPVIDLTPYPSTNCDLSLANGGMTASVDETATGGGAAETSGYTFNWYDGDDVSDPFISSGSGLNNINGGTAYTVEVRNDATGCTNVKSLTLADNSEKPVVKLTKVDNTICDSSIGYDGSVTAQVTYMGSTVTLPDADYEFTWYAGTTTSDPVIAVGDDNDPALTSIEGGLYAVSVFIPSLGCTSDPVSIEVFDALVFPDIVLTPTPSTNCDPSLPNGQMSAVVDETSSGGGAAITAGYSFVWHDGSTTADPQIETNPVLGNINGGSDYTVEVTNNSTGCSGVKTLTLADNSEKPIVQLTKIDNTICDNGIGYNGSVTAQVTYMGSTISLPDADYELTWYDGTTTSDPVISVPDSNDPVLAGIEGGDYTVSLFIPSLGCTSDPVSIEVKDDQYFPDIDIAVTPQTNCVGLSGALSASIDDAIIGGSGDPNEYSFTWFEYDNVTNTSSALSVGVVGGTNNEQVTQLPGGYYRLEVERTASGCINDKVVYVPENITEPLVSITKNSDMTTCGAPDGELTADVGGVQIGYTFYWYDGNDAPDEDFVINNADQILADDGNYAGLIPGDYMVVAIDNTTGCVSPLKIEQIVDATNAINIAINIDSSPSNCGVNDGEMTATPTVALTVTDPDTDFIYEWYAGGPTNTDPIDFFTNPPVFTAASISGSRNITGLMEGTYTLVVTYLPTGCSELRSIYLPFAESPVVTASVTNSTECPYTSGNGVVEFDIDASAVNPALVPGGDPSGAIDNDNFTLRFREGANQTDPIIYGPVELNDPYNAADDNATITIPLNLTPGFYTIQLTEDYTGTSCSLYEVVEVGIDAQPPVVSLVGSVTANTACDVVSSADGKFTVNIAQDVDDVTVGTTYQVDLSPDPNGGSLPAGQPAGNHTFDQLPPDDYTVLVTASTGCESTRVFTVPDAPTVSEIVDGSVIITEADLCDPSGSIEITDINLIGVGPASLDDFEFTWYDDAGLTNMVYQAQGDATATNGGEVLDNVNYVSMGAGNYWVIAEKSTGVGAGCTSAPFKAAVPDIHVNPEISLSAESNTSCSDNIGIFEGKLFIKASTTSGPGVGASYDYSITGPGSFSFTGTGNGNALDANADGVDDDGDDDIVSGLDDGTYTVVATNQTTGCSVTGTITVPKNKTPILITDAVGTDQELCTIDGQVEVTGVSIDGGVTNRPLNEFEYRWFRDDPNSAPLEDDFSSLIVSSTLVAGTAAGEYSSMGAGSYYVKAIRLTGFSPGAGCESPPARVDIQDVHVNPEISLSSESNTSCSDNIGIFEGKIFIEANTTSGPGVSASYDYKITGPGSFSFTGIGNGNALDADSDDADDDGDDDILTGLDDGSYTVVVTNQTTGCLLTGTITVPKNKTPILITDAVGTDQELCAIDGQVEVTGVSIDGGLTNRPLNEFEYRWFRDDPNSAPLEDDFGSLIVSSTLVAGTAAGEYSSMGAGTYYVKAIRLTGFSPGAGCESPPALVDIRDVSVNPTISVTKKSNTSCDGNFDGGLALFVSDSKGPGAGGMYDYIVSGPNAFSFTGSGDGDGSLADGDDDELLNLEDGTYTITATNQTTSCSFTVTATISYNPEPIDVKNVTVDNQDICFPDGRIVVNVVDPGSLANYTFQWFKSDPNTTPLEDDFGAPIDLSVLEPGTGVGQYSALGAGTYYVIAIRVTGSDPGSGCPSPPFRADIQDLSTDPVPFFTFTENTACDDTKANGSLTVTVEEDDGSSTDPYTFTWTFEGGALPGMVTQDDSGGNSSVLSGALDGLFSVTVFNATTGCDILSSFNLTRNETMSEPNIIDVDIDNPDDCNPTGSATVQSISIGGAPPITDPTRLDTEFSYTWYVGDVDPSSIITGVNTRYDSSLTVGTYYVQVVSLLTGCVSIPKEVDILDDDVIYPVVNISQPIPQISCGNPFSGQLLAVARESDGTTGTNYSFSWTPSEGGMIPAGSQSDTPTSSTLSGLPVGRYDVIVTNTTTNCTATALYIIQDESGDFYPIISSGENPITSCNIDNGAVYGKALEIQNYPFAYSYTIDWYVGDNPDFANDTPISSATGVTVKTAIRAENLPEGLYTIRMEDEITRCVTTKVQEVTGARTFPEIVIVEENPLINCDPARPNGQLSATANGGQVGGYSFEWYEGTTATGTLLSDQNRLIGVQDGDFTVKVTNNVSGCSSEMTGMVTDGRLPAPTPTPELLANVTDCVNPNGRLIVTVNGETQGYHFEWYDESGNLISTNVSVIDLDVGTYSVKAIDNVTGCESELANIDVNDETLIPEFAFTTEGSSCDFATGKAFLKVTNSVNLAEIRWYEYDESASDNKGTYLGVMGTDLINVPAGTYLAEGTSFESCVGQGIVEVGTVITNYNLVSSDGDGINDNFQIDCITNYPNNNVKIFNRTGVLVYEIDGYNNADKSFQGIGENGVYTMGDQLPNGTYYYVIDKGDGSKLISGFLELIR